MRGSEIDWRRKYVESVFYTPIAVVHSLSFPTHHVTMLIKNMLTHRLARTPQLPPAFLSFYLSQHILIPLLLLDHCLLLSLSHSSSSSFSPPPPSPSFWRFGSSEVVAVCIAKGNVSSTHRKMGQNIRTLPAHAQWHTQCGGYMHDSESDHCVLSYPLPHMNVATSHSCLFSSIIDGAKLLTAKFTTAAIIVEQCGGLDMEKMWEEMGSIC